ncbi:MAG: topoisomerase DNA-binding C4 zinc finger domain-containing protein [Selenomonadaceae bacterium]|nr:topoisomerase DNA-binding C4 zinc finger domain-containing protein [Selenomonadaceae bacterium]
MAKAAKKSKKKVKLQGSVSRLKTLILTDTSEKARTIKKLISRQYVVMSSEGFLRDLPKTQLGIDPDNHFEPRYITVRGKGKLLEQIRKETITARRIYAITDEDPQGEMIALHYCQLFGINSSSNFRIVLNEITKDSIKEGLKNARAVDMKLIRTYEAQRAVNRLFTYNLHPILWNKIYRGVSVNLSQAVILRMICEQEKKPQPFSEEVTVDKENVLNWKSLQLAAAKELNFHVGTTSIIARQFYEGMKIGNTCTGLITWYKSSKIIPADVQYSPETVKDYLPANHFKLYSLIWQHFHGELSEIKSSKSVEPMIRYNDYLLMTTLEQRGLPWEDNFSTAVCSLLKRRYIELTNTGYKPTKLGLEVMSVLRDHFATIISDKFIKKIHEQLSSAEDKMSAVEVFWKQFNNTLTKALDKIGDVTPKEPPVLESNEVCDKCGKKMVIRYSRYGQFLACSGYPECKNTKPYLEYIDNEGCRCPKCGGRLTRRRWNKGKIFYSCENYPECRFSTWDEPQSKFCDICGGALFLHRFKDRAPMLYCGNDDCSSRRDHPINKILENQRIKREVKANRASKKVEATH